VAIILRIDVDRPYGKRPALRHVLSRLSSDICLPRIEWFGYLKELEEMLQMLNEKNARSYVFFRRCTLPSRRVLGLLDQGRHEIGLHLEDSRSFQTFEWEKVNLEQHLGKKVFAVSKHGSGGAKHGYHHFPRYEPEKYVEWAGKSAMRVFFGNLEDPCLGPARTAEGVLAYPAAFWLEPHWRDTKAFPVDWLLSQARGRDIVMLVHPENVLESSALTRDFQRIIDSVETTIIE